MDAMRVALGQSPFIEHGPSPSAKVIDHNLALMESIKVSKYLQSLYAHISQKSTFPGYECVDCCRESIPSRAMGCEDEKTGSLE